MTNDLIVQFAILWGMEIGSARNSLELENAEKLKAYDSEDCLKLFSEWADEYISSNADDTVDFFIEKLPQILNKEE